MTEYVIMGLDESHLWIPLARCDFLTTAELIKSGLQNAFPMTMFTISIMDSSSSWTMPSSPNRTVKNN